MYSLFWLCEKTRSLFFLYKKQKRNTKCFFTFGFKKHIKMRSTEKNTTQISWTFLLRLFCFTKYKQFLNISLAKMLFFVLLLSHFDLVKMWGNLVLLAKMLFGISKAWSFIQNTITSTTNKMWNVRRRRKSGSLTSVCKCLTPYIL